MVIDFHTHAFPDKIAVKTIALLEKSSNNAARACTDGTISGLTDKAAECGVSLCVVLPIATKASQTEHINDFAQSIKSDRLISFGSLHPFDENRLAILEDLSRRGFIGIKLHPEYQCFDIDCKESIEILRKAEQLGMYVVVHAGSDPAYEAPFHCTPQKIANALGYVSGKNLIAAHMGGLMMWDDVAKYLIGTPISFDTAAVSAELSASDYRSLILEHGADRVIFGSDCPWEDPKQTLSALKALKLPKADFEQITYLNACVILGINAKGIEK